MANIGRFKDRNADLRAAGVSSAVDYENHNWKLHDYIAS